MDLEIRIAVFGDANIIASLLHCAFVEYESAYTPEAFRATTLESRLIRDRMAEGPVWVAARGAKILGTVAAIPRGEMLYIRGMAVAPEARERGIGGRLLDHVEKFAVQNGFKLLSLSTTPFLKHAIHLYQQCGFRFTNTEPTDLFGTPLLTMIKILE